MATMLPFFVILIAGLIFSEIFKRLHLPYVTALIIAGIVIGPFMLNLITADETVTVMASIGVIFLMFMAGSEIKSKSFEQIEKNVFILALLNGAIPFITGYAIGAFFGYNFFTSIILGAAFISSSVAVIIPSLESSGLMRTKLGKTIVSSTVIEDICSLIFLALILQSFTQRTALPLPIYLPIIVLLIVILKIFIPKIQNVYYHKKSGKDLFESELRFVFVVLLATVLLFESIGMHAIVAGFLIGIILSDSIGQKLDDKIRTISYGFFIPIFFLVIGIQTDLSVLFSSNSILLSLTIILGLLLSKIISGFIGGKAMKFSTNESLLMGIATTPQLSTTLAIAFSALSLGLLAPEIIASLVILSIITTFSAPLMIKSIVSGMKSKST